MPVLLFCFLGVSFCVTTSDRADSMEVALVTSNAWKIPPSSASPVFTSQQTTRQPSSAKRSAVAFPIPLAAPVTITTLFFSPVSIMMTILDNKHHLRGCWSVLILLTIVSQVGAQQDDLALARSYAERNELPAAEAEARPLEKLS